MIVSSDTADGAFVLILKGWYPVGLVREADLDARTFKRIIFCGPVFGDLVMVDGRLEDHGTFDHFTVGPGGPDELINKVKHLPGYVDYADPVANAECRKARNGPYPPWLVEACARGKDLERCDKGLAQ